MELITILFLILFLFAIPIVLVKTVGKEYGSDSNISKAMFKIIFSFFGYALLSIFTLLFLVFVNIGPDPKPEYKTPFENKIIGLTAVFVYGIVGWLWCSFVSGKIVKPWLIFRFKTEKPQSILDTK